jgi:hypothetical protein
MYGEEMKVTYVGSPRNHTFYSGFQLSPGVTVTKTDFSSIISNHETGSSRRAGFELVGMRVDQWHQRYE